jgi:hypothetical protein
VAEKAENIVIPGEFDTKVGNILEVEMSMGHDVIGRIVIVRNVTGQEFSMGRAVHGQAAIG